MPTAADTAPQSPTAESPRYTMRERMALSAAVGFDFAACESAGCTFNPLFARIGLLLVGTAAPPHTAAALAPVVAGDPAVVPLRLGPARIGIAAARVG